MQTNVKGFIGLFSGIAAFILLFASFIPTARIEDTTLSLPGHINVILATVACVLGLVAIVFGAMSVKHKDKKGPRKTGIVLGIFAIIFSFVCIGIHSLFAWLVDYANGDLSEEQLSSMDKDSREKLDDFVKQVRDEFGK